MKPVIFLFVCVWRICTCDVHACVVLYIHVMFMCVWYACTRDAHMGVVYMYMCCSCEVLCTCDTHVCGVHVHVMFICVWCAYTCERHLFSSFFVTGSLTGLELTKAMLAGQGALPISSLPALGLQATPSCPDFFLWVWRASNADLVLGRKALYPPLPLFLILCCQHRA